MSGIFDTPAPRIFTTPPQADFLKLLAATLKAEFGTTPESLAQVTVLTPTRRAGRALAAAFSDIDGSAQATLLPLIRPIGDVDADDPPFEPGELAGIAPPAINPVRRSFELARLILEKDRAQGGEMPVSGAITLAGPLATLIDDIWTEGAEGVPALGDQIRSLLPEHLQQSADFVAIVLTYWPERLKELGFSDPAQRRSALLSALARRWRETPPDGPVIAAGSTGSIPAAADLMATIAGLPQGAVVLPGLDRDMDDKAWTALKADDQHPQQAMQAFLEKVGLARQDVADWPGDAVTRTGQARQRVIAEALRPAEETSDWLKRIGELEGSWGEGFLKSGFSGLSLIEAPTPEMEARAIALALRETLETPGKTAMVVTPDRGLADRVLSAMRSYGIALDDSAGRPLSQTPAGSFLRLILDAALDPGAAAPLVALWASPLFALGEDRGSIKQQLDGIDIALRGARPGRSFADVSNRLEDKSHIGILQRLTASLEALTGADRPVADWARAHAEAAEALAATDKQDGALRLWKNEDGEAAALLLRELITESDVLPNLSLRAYLDLFDTLARSRPVRPRGAVHPRLSLLGPIEARLLSADRVILAGLNEGIWPAALGQNPWMSRGMRQSAGLPPREKRLGLAAHDFAQLACAPEAILTRSARQDGAPAVASRWLWRLQTLARGALGADGAALSPDSDYIGLAHALDFTPAPEPVREPRPCPPVKVRPDTLSVTEVRNWIRDPYSIYARRVLGLRAIDALDQNMQAAERGTAIHKALEMFLKETGSGPLPKTALEDLKSHGRQAAIAAGMDEAELVPEMIRFERLAQWFLDWEARRRETGIRPAALECWAEWAVGDTGFTLRGKADRLDSRPDGRIDILDYKTGRTPSPTATAAGFEPQAPLEAAMVRDGAFDDLDPAEPGDLLYLQLGGGSTPGAEKPVNQGRNAKPTDELMAEYEAVLHKLIARYRQEDTPYLSQIFAQFENEWGDYDRLARRAEWSSAEEDKGGGS
ncbi:double-strand break repair protein AddB [Hyphobacterium sp. HN65]|uniref:Double-strand break repair protein AddB n=1 Tax=Hyphobacterium lacteum TaxID=3116575 RepID=A0ABU7LSN9_9PROT|nr:double-strand break repair protein AddB [Hyphobacterium sp. HN65]MEE2526938.1 double-strand break repair protein AddB [Hyphobacterium sp. HN65]